MYKHLSVLTLVATSAAAQPTRYTYHPLMAVGNSSVADWNNQQQGVGSIPAGEGGVGAFRLNFTGPIGPINALASINDRGDVAGTEVVNLGEYRFATAVIGGVSTRLSGNRSDALDINSASRVLVRETSPSKAYIWRPGTGAGPDIRAPEGVAPASVVHLNNADQAIGSYTVSLTGGVQQTRGFRWTDVGGAEPIALLPGTNGFTPRSINDDGAVLGAATRSVGSGSLVLAQPSGALIDIPGSANQSFGTLTNAGQVVFGRSIWDQTNGTRDLVPLIDFPVEPPLTYSFGNVISINDKGWILGYGVIQYSLFNSQQIYVMLEPTPTPGTPVAMLAFSSLCGMRRTRPSSPRK